MAQHPVALSVKDCSNVPAVVQAIKCKVRGVTRQKGSALGYHITVVMVLQP